MPRTQFANLKPGDKFRFSDCAALGTMVLTKLKGRSQLSGAPGFIGYYQKTDGTVQYFLEAVEVAIPKPFRRKQWVKRAVVNIPSGSRVRCINGSETIFYTLAKDGMGQSATVLFAPNSGPRAYPTHDAFQLLVEEDVEILNEFEDEYDKKEKP